MPILVVDEATSLLDNETSYNIEKSILNIPKLTCLVVTHILNTLVSYPIHKNQYPHYDK